ncbi:hypothetical protein Salat_1423200 [Sesamum alatum]|uniref:Uncharacterized protein n=1 Tax=Sesamum alatum TaxID=300844 RepID=A0AAE2CLG6_9LAMI|nr:hypothetical protein Salat_1423200 [Sesamum alatum]
MGFAVSDNESFGGERVALGLRQDGEGPGFSISQQHQAVVGLVGWETASMDEQSVPTEVGIVDPKQQRGVGETWGTWRHRDERGGTRVQIEEGKLLNPTGGNVGRGAQIRMSSPIAQLPSNQTSLRHQATTQPYSG